jgi:hypothetical protein
VELSWAQKPILAALFDMESFPQTVSLFTGAAGYTSGYSPAILCLLDFIERRCGILPRPDGTLWLTGLVPEEVIHKDQRHQTAYSRMVDGVRFELLNDGTTVALLRDGTEALRFPYGVRVSTDRAGHLSSVTGLVAREVTGTVSTPDNDFSFSVGPNEVLSLVEGQLVTTRGADLVPISY